MNSKKSLLSGITRQGRFSIILLLEKAKKGTITLLYRSKEDKSNNAIALKEYLDAKLKHNK